MTTIYLITDKISSLSSSSSAQCLLPMSNDAYNIFKDTNTLFKESDTNTENDHKYLSNEMKLKIIQLKLKWKSFQYKSFSRRSVMHNIGLSKSPYVDIEYERNLYFSSLNEFSKHPVICIDGINGVGKSTITQNINRKYCKINLLRPEITRGQDYNIYPLHAIEYLMSQLQVSSEPSVWDRDRYSNLRFYFVHFIIYQFRNEILSNDDDCTLRVYEKLNAMAQTVALKETLSFFETMYPNVPTLIILNSDIKRVGHMLLNRSGKNDVFNAKSPNYQYAQHHVYNYFAKILEHPIIDLSFVYEKFGLTVTETHNEIKKRIAYKPFVAETDKSNANIETQITEAINDVDKHTDDTNDDNDNEAFVSARALHIFCKNNNDSLMYIFSKK